VDVTWPGSEIIEFDSKVRCCAQILRDDKPFSDLICAGINPELE